MLDTDIDENIITEKYGVNFEDLTEMERYRDGCIHFKHNVTGKVYSWNTFKKFWFIKDMFLPKVDKNKGLSQSQLIKEIYGVNFDFLTKMDATYEDNIIYFKHNETNRIYSWNENEKSWKKENDDIRKNLINNFEERS